CSLDLHAGEVLGIGGLVGAGRTELARLIFGGEPRMRGDVRIADKAFGAHSPRDSIDAGLVYLTEDRKRQGLFLDMSVRDNINIAVAGRDGHSGVLDLARGAQRARDAISSLSIRVPHANVNAGALSGGNQQKVLLSRLLETKPRVLILDEPTRGVDIGAKSEIYRIINALAREGVGVIVISSELPELIGIADRVLVMREGQIAGELGGYSGEPISQEAIIALATGSQTELAQTH
ncbi:MAG TPA: ATP-binding cassette domain-containing protein, partial [Albitalea sp.]|nr:ATP-binding cassette domain-containing protein [Albitalea sp.]